LAVREAPLTASLCALGRRRNRFDDRDLVGIDRGGTFEKPERGQGRVVRRIAREMRRVIGMLVGGPLARARVAVAHAIVMEAAFRRVKQRAGRSGQRFMLH
jgi:hypothetical protein